MTTCVRQRSFRVHLLAAISLTILPMAAVAADFICTWSGGASAWTNPDNWTSCNGTYPDNGDGLTYVAINSTWNEVRLNDTVTVDGLEWNIPRTLEGSFDLTVLHQLTWSDGWIDGDGVGVFRTLGNSVVGLQTTLGIRGVRFVNEGHVQAAVTQFSGSNGAVIENRSIWEDVNNVFGDFRTATGGAVFMNAGTYLKTGSGFTRMIFSDFHSSGTVEILNGTLSFFGPATHAGEYRLGPAGTLDFSRSDHALSAQNFTRTDGTLSVSFGEVHISGPLIFAGTVQATGGALILDDDTELNRLTMDGGVLDGPASVTVNSPAAWMAGYQRDLVAGTGVTYFTQGANLEGAGIKGIFGRAVIARQHSVWSGGQIWMSYGGNLRNEGTWHDQLVTDSAVVNRFGGAPSLFTNVGIYSKTGPARTSIAVPFDNAGLVVLQQGVLEMTAGGSHRGGSFTGQASAGIVFGGDHDFDAQSSVVSSNVIFQSGSSTVRGSIDIPEQFAVTGGSLSIEGPVAQIVDGALETGLWTVSSGAELVLAGSQDLHVNNAELVIGNQAVTNILDKLTENAGSIRVSGGRNLHETLVNTGALSLDGAFLNAGMLVNSTSGRIQGHGTIAADLTNDGLINGDSLRFEGSVVTNTALSGRVSIAGRLESGPSAAVIQAHDLAFEPTARIRIRVASAAEFGKMVVSGTLMAAGVMEIIMEAGFQADPGLSLPIVQVAGDFSGAFTVEIVDAPSQLVAVYRADTDIGYVDFLLDTDDDGVADRFDVFPQDPSETTDTDGDGVGDNADVFPEDPTETIDSDGDGVGDNADAFPFDPQRWENPRRVPALPIMFQVILLVLLCAVGFTRMRKTMRV